MSARSLARLFEGAFEESVSIDGARLRDTRPRDLLIRFAFGFLVSVIAGIVSIGIGARAGGLFLAFPAILPASLTLIADKESESQAEVDAGGALIGAAALVAFAVVAWQTLARLPLAVAEGAAFAAWLTASMTTYFAVRAMFRRRRPRPPSSAPDGTGSGEATLGYGTRMTKLIDDVQERMAAEGREYSHGDDRPLAGYVRIMAVYGGAMVGLGALVAVRRRPLPERPAAGDLALVALATAKLARLTTRDSVTSPLRAPFTTFEGPGGPAEVKEKVRGDGFRHAIGELVTCPFCVSQWVATGFTFGLLLAPRATRQVAGTLAALELADLLQFGRAAAEKVAS